MAELKTQPNNASVEAFLNTLDDQQQKNDSHRVVQLMSEATGQPPKMWGKSIVGFGQRHLKYASGRELDWLIIGFSPRKQNLTLYVLDNENDYQNLLAKLGPHTTGKSCLYIKRLSDVDEAVLKQVIERAAKANST